MLFGGALLKHAKHLNGCLWDRNFLGELLISVSVDSGITGNWCRSGRKNLSNSSEVSVDGEIMELAGV